MEQLDTTELTDAIAVDADAVIDDAADRTEPSAAVGLAGSSVIPANAVIGRVAAPMRYESTPDRYYFWFPDDQLVERTQLVRTEGEIAGKAITWYGVVEEVRRRSRGMSIDADVDLFDGNLAYEPPFRPEGVTFAEVAVLTIEPAILTPPREQSLVFLGGADDAAKAYGYDEMGEWQLPIGLLRNGGLGFAGRALIDLRDLNGDRAGHLNVTGQAGRGTKSSFLLAVVRALIDFARDWDNGDQSRTSFHARPIVFNVKGNDLMYIDQWSRIFRKDEAAHRQQWAELGLVPRPFERAEFYAPSEATRRGVDRTRPRVLRRVAPDRQTRVYYWTLADVVRFGLWSYLFSDDVQHNESMTALADHVLGCIATDCNVDDAHPAGLRLRDATDPMPGFVSRPPQSFAELRAELRASLRAKGEPPASLDGKDHAFRDNGAHTFATCRAVASRLNHLLNEGSAIFDQDMGQGRPLLVTGQGTIDPLVIDIAALVPELRRFVVAAVLDQVKEHQTGPSRARGQTYFLVLDELGVYAPRGARDPITRLFEHVAAQLRSQGIILLGAQQQASRVSEVIVGNSAFRALGYTDPVELSTGAWNGLLNAAQKSRALTLRHAEKMVLTPSGWMNLVVPYPAWPMKESEVELPALLPSGANGAGGAFPLNLRDA